MSDMNKRKVSLSDILFEDYTYKIGFKKIDENLIQSITRIGLLDIPVVIEHNNGYVIVSGFNRLGVLRTTGCLEVETIVWREFYPADFEREILRKIYLRSIGPIGRIHAFRILMNSHYLKTEEHIKCMGERLGVTHDLIKKVTIMEEYPALLSFIDRKDTGFKIVSSVSGYGDEFAAFIDACLVLKDFRFSIFRSIVDMYGDILRNSSMKDMMSNEMRSMDVSLSDDEICAKFRMVRYPASEEYSRKLTEIVSAFKNHGVTLNIPGYSEGSEATVSFQCRRKDGGKSFKSATEFLNGIDPKLIINYL